MPGGNLPHLKPEAIGLRLHSAHTVRCANVNSLVVTLSFLSSLCVLLLDCEPLQSVSVSACAPR